MIKGVDRSHLNSPVSLDSLTKRGIGFVWFKGTQAVSYTDPTFNASWQEAKATPGLVRGAYHFFDPRYDGVVQAEHFLSLGINFSGEGCLPPCVDVEDLVGADDASTKAANQWVYTNWETAVQRLNDFLAHMKQATGRDCVIYTYNNYPKEYFRGQGFPNNPMWLSSLRANCPPRYDTGQQPIFWQYTYGWNKTDMDGDYFMGSQSDLNTLANIQTTT